MEQYNQEQERLDYRAALICTVMANVFRNPKKRAFKIEDFMPHYSKSKQTPEEMLSVVKSLQSRYEGK